MVEDASLSLRTLERVLRRLIEDVLRSTHGASWVDELGVPPERVGGWRLRLEEESKRRTGGISSSSLLDYSEFTDLRLIVHKHWETFRPCFRDKKQFNVYMERLSDLRNPDAHARPLLPFERPLMLGMSDELRQMVAIYRSEAKVGTPQLFPYIESLRDSYGHELNTATQRGNWCTHANHASSGRGCPLRRHCPRPSRRNASLEH